MPGSGEEGAWTVIIGTCMRFRFDGDFGAGSTGRCLYRAGAKLDMVGASKETLKTAMSLPVHGIRVVRKPVSYTHLTLPTKRIV